MASRTAIELAQFALRGLPFWRGKHRLVNTLAPRLGSLPEPSYAAISGGAKMLVTEETHRDFWYLGVYEPEVTRVFVDQLAALSPQECFVDIGANAGYYSLIAAASGVAEVHAFEPGALPMAQLRANLEFNGFDNVHCVNGAVAEQSGTARLHMHESVTSLSSLGAVHADLDRSVEVETLALDDYFAELPETPVGLIKADIQGGELGALRGGASLLERDRPALIIEEWPYGAEGFGYDYREVKAFLSQFGYRFYRIDQGRFRWSVVSPADPVEADVECARDIDTNLLCLAP